MKMTRGVFQTLGQGRAAVLDSSERKPNGKGKVAILFLHRAWHKGWCSILRPRVPSSVHAGRGEEV